MLSAFSVWLALAPLWQIGVAIVVGLIAASVLGGALRRRHARIAARGDGSQPSEDGETGTMISAVLGLLALLVAFTFSIALDRFDARRANVLNEANAIGTTYLRAQLLEEPHRTRISRLLIQYTDNRLTLAAAQPGPEQAAMLAINDRLIVDLWTETVAAYPSIRAIPLSHSFVETMNEMIDMDSTRKAGRQARVPAAVFMILILYQLIAAAVVNYGLTGKAGRRTAVVLSLLLAMLMVLIIDLDRPTSGGITESQEPMLQLQAFMRTSPPASFNRSDAPAAPAVGRPAQERPAAAPGTG
jgi:hypothetical protein